MTTIVFSKDRALQLHAFLRSYADHVTPLTPVDVLYHASNARHEQSYRELFLEFSWVVDLKQTTFKRNILHLLPNAGSVAFFVDDQIFIRPWQQADEPGLSLRLAPHLTRDYPTNAWQQKPAFVSKYGDRRSWRWKTGDKGWAYPLSLDGHVFDAAEIRPMIASLEFSSPNALEAALQCYLPTFGDRLGTCYTEAKVVSVPWNRVQTECDNRHGDGPSVESMLHAWEVGMQIDVSGIYGVVNESCHQEFPCVLEQRKARAA